MTVQQTQEIIDRVMQAMALRHGSSTRRDFEVACLVIYEVIENGTQRTSEIGSVPSEALLAHGVCNKRRGTKQILPEETREAAEAYIESRRS